MMLRMAQEEATPNFNFFEYFLLVVSIPLSLAIHKSIFSKIDTKIYPIQKLPINRINVVIIFTPQYQI